MATQAVDLRSDRVVVLVSKAEKAALAESARAVGMTVSDYVRTATERFDAEGRIPPAMQDEMLRQVEQVKARAQKTVDDLDRYLADRREPDRREIRAEVFAELDKEDVDWDRFRALLGIAA